MTKLILTFIIITASFYSFKPIEKKIAKHPFNTRLNTPPSKKIPLENKNNRPPIIRINNTSDPESLLSQEQLLNQVLFKNNTCAGINNIEFQTSGAPDNTEQKSYGYFNKGNSNGFPLEEGIILSTGSAFNGGNTFYPATDTANRASRSLGLPTDEDLAIAVGEPKGKITDASFIKFDFIPLKEKISFRYLLASEEYLGSNNCEFFDVFAILIREKGASNYTNLAILPDGSPINSLQVNNNENCLSNPEFFEGYELGDTNYDGRTKVFTATTSVIPNTTYEIKFVIADKGRLEQGTGIDSVFDTALFIETVSIGELTPNLGPDITVANQTAVCPDESITLNTNTPSGTHTWFKDGIEIQNAGSESTLEINESGTYSVNVVYPNMCEDSDSILVEFIPVDNASFTLIPTCDGLTAQLDAEAAAGGVFSFTGQAPTDGSSINPETGTVTNGTNNATYSITYTTNGACPTSESQSGNVLSMDNANFVLTPNCTGATASPEVEGGTFAFNPEPTDTANIDSRTGTITNITDGTTYSVTYTVNQQCENTERRMITFPTSPINLNETYVVCRDAETNTVIMEAEIDTGLSTDDFSFEWFFNDVIINEETDSVLLTPEVGEYKVTVTNNETTCSHSDTTQVILSSPPIINAEVTTDAFSDNNIIEISTTAGTNPNNSSDYEFRLDLGEWMQNSPNTNTFTFQNVQGGIHTVSVRDRNGCGDQVSIDVLVLDYPLFFTPNNDGIHDTWHILGIENQVNSKIFIFNRYGKLLKQLLPNGNGWDGTYNGKQLPADDYWFTVDYFEPGDITQATKKIFRAHFTLKR